MKRCEVLRKFKASENYIASLIVISNISC